MARRFQFRLHALLRLREAMEQEARRALARLMDSRRTLEAGLEAVREERTAAFEARRTEPGTPVDLQRWRLVERYLVVLERREASLREELRRVAEQTEAARAAVVRARQERMTLTRLMERRKLLHDQENDRKERLEVDDLAVLRHRTPAAPRPAGGTP